MKRALAILAVASMFGFAGLAQGTLTGQWDFDFTLGMRDVVITDPGATITIEGGTYAVSQGFITIPDKAITIHVAGQDIPVVIPGGSYPVGPWEITLPGMTLPVTQGTVTIPAKTIPVTIGDTTCTVTVPSVTVPVGPWEITLEGMTLPVTQGTVTIPAKTIPVTIGDTTCTVTVPAYTAEVKVPVLVDKKVDVLLFEGEKDIGVLPPRAYYEYSGEVAYHYVIQSGSQILEEGDGVTTLEDLGLDEAGEVPFPVWDWELLCWSQPAHLWLHGATDVSLFPEPGKHLQVNFPEFEVKIKCADLADPWMLMVLGRTATGFDQNNNQVTVTLQPHYVTLSADETTTVKVPPEEEVWWAYTPEPFEGQHWLFIKIAPKEFIVHWPDWPRCCTSEEPRPYVEIGWEDYDTAVYQYIGEETELEAIKADVTEHGEAVLDKIGFGFLDTESKTYEVTNQGRLHFFQGDIEGTFLLGSYYGGTEETKYIEIPERTATGTCNGQTVQVTIPGGTYPVSDQSVTIPPQTITIPEDQIEIPERTATGTCQGQSIEIVVPGGTYDVSDQSVTIPEQTITIPAKNVVIPDKTVTVSVSGQDITLLIPGGTYEVSDQYVTIPDKTITIPGWSQTIEKLPDFGFKTSLKLVYTIAGWEFTSVSKFEDATFSDQSFEVSGNIGAASVTGKMSFDPSTPAYKSSWVKATLDFAGVSFTMKVAHDPEKMVYTLEASSDPLSATVAFQDDCTGIYFKDAKVSLKGISFCCDVTYDVETSFSKANGFEYLKFTAKNLFPICCGISFDMSVKFTTDMKEVSITPKLAEIGDACFTLYADLDWSNNAIGGLEVYGWKIRCDLAECNYIEFLTALDPSYKAFKDIFKGDEFQYAKFGFCGPGCCGGNYKVDVAIYFDNGGGLFGVSRLGANLEIPVMSNFTARASFSTMEPVLGFGWTFKF